MNRTGGLCLGRSWGAPTRPGTGRGVLPGWHGGCSEGSPPCPGLCPRRPRPAPLRTGTCGAMAPGPGLRRAPQPLSCGSFAKRLGSSVVGDAPQRPLPACHRPPATQTTATLSSARLAPYRGGRWVGLSQDPGPGPHAREGGCVRGGARRRASRRRWPRGRPPRTYPRAAGALGRGGRSPSARTVPSCKSLPANDRDKYFNGNNRKQLLSSDRGSLTTGDV